MGPLSETSSAEVAVEQVAAISAEAVYAQVSAGYRTFNDKDLESTRAQLGRYNNQWIDQLPETEKAEATR